MRALPVLMYHHVSDDREVTVSQFEAQIKFLKENGWHTATLDEAYGHITGAKPLSGKNVLITFDDGYADNWICAWPVLNKYEMRAVVFVTTDRVTDNPVRPTVFEGAPSPDTLRDERGLSGFLSWPEISVMAESGVFEIGGHTHTHKDFDKRAEYRDIDGELSESYALIAERVGTKPAAMAWPWGFYKKGFIESAVKVGYKMLFTTRGGSNFPGSNPREIARFKVKCGDVRWLEKRLKIYSMPCIGNLYGLLYGLDSKLKWTLLRLLGKNGG